MRIETVGQRAAVPGSGVDPRVEALLRAVGRVRRELAAHPAELPDRQAAEDELAALDALARQGISDLSRLRGSLLPIAAALGSVSALAPSLAELRLAVELFGGA